MTTLKIANLTLSFVLELCLLAALGYWGLQAGGSMPVKLLLGGGAVVLTAVFWGVFLAPKAQVVLPALLGEALKFGLFGLGTAALFAAGRPGLGWAFGAAFAINRILAYVLGDSAWLAQ